MKRIIPLILLLFPAVGNSQTVTKYMLSEESPDLIHYSLIDETTDIVIEEGRYLGNSRDGIWIKRWPNGKPQTQAKFEQGVEVGVWRFWNEDGDLVIKKKYNRKGELVFVAQYRYY